MQFIDLRSDTVTRPTPDMLRSMTEAEVGDDVYGEDPTVNRLESFAADLLGKKAAIFCPSGTQSNLLALLTHCQRGDEYIVGQTAHTYKYEGGGAAVLGSIQPQPLLFESNGTLDLKKVADFIKPDNFHFARTRLLCLENTHNGKALPMAYLKEAHQFTNDNHLVHHLDGARVFNAAVKLGVDVKEITQYFDTVSCCLSKGLGAPVGSVLAGSRHQIDEARKWRKMLGGGMRQAGILAAAGLYALSNNVERLREDHENAHQLAEQLSEIDSVTIDQNMVHTNIVFAEFKADIYELAKFLKEKGILITVSNPCRMVTHLDVSKNNIRQVVEAVKTFLL